MYIHQNAFLSLARFDIEMSVQYALYGERQGVYFFVIEGAATVEGRELKRRDALGMWDTENVTIQAKKSAFLLAIEVPMGEFV